MRVLIHGNTIMWMLMVVIGIRGIVTRYDVHAMWCWCDIDVRWGNVTWCYALQCDEMMMSIWYDMIWCDVMWCDVMCVTSDMSGLYTQITFLAMVRKTCSHTHTYTYNNTYTTTHSMSAYHQEVINPPPPPWSPIDPVLGRVFRCVNFTTKKFSPSEGGGRGGL